MNNAELLERFLPGYRIVCRLFAKYLHIDLTDFMTKAFVLFALFKSAQYVWRLVVEIVGGWVVSGVVVPKDEGEVYEDVLSWVGREVLEKGSRGVGGVEMGMGVRVVAVASRGREDAGFKVNGVNGSRRSTSSLRYEPAFDSPMWFFRGWRVIFLRRQKTVGAETILLTCIGLTTEPLRSFLDECVESGSAARGKSGKLNGKAE